MRHARARGGEIPAVQESNTRVWRLGREHDALAEADQEFEDYLVGARTFRIRNDEPHTLPEEARP
jgi:hypothetical protein